MRVVLDTNVLVSGLMTRGGTCAIIRDLLIHGRLTAARDDRIMNEYRPVCADPRLRLDSEAVQDLLHFLPSWHPVGRSRGSHKERAIGGTGRQA